MMKSFVCWVPCVKGPMYFVRNPKCFICLVGRDVYLYELDAGYPESH